MKRKVKIFTMLASFCLAIMLLAFGVYAATSVNYTLGGNISFTVSEPYGKIYLDSVYEGSLSSGNELFSNTVESLTYSTANKVTSGAYGVTAEGGESSRVKEDLNLNYTFSEDVLAYKYTFKVSTLNTAEIAVKVTTGAEIPASDNIGEKVVLSEDTITAADGEQTVTYYLFLRNKTKNATTIEYSVNIELNFASEMTGGWSNPNEYLEPQYTMYTGSVVGEMESLTEATNIAEAQFVKFGTYDGEPILWDCYLNDDRTTMTLVSHYILENRAFNKNGENEYDGSDIQQYLTGDFYNNNFTADEKEIIQPQDLTDVLVKNQTIYLLNDKEIDDLIGGNFDDAIKYELKNRTVEGCWWIRTPFVTGSVYNLSKPLGGGGGGGSGTSGGSTSGDSSSGDSSKGYAYFVESNGFMDYNCPSPTYEYYGLVPALTILI